MSGTFVSVREKILLPWPAARTRGGLEAEPVGRASHPDLTAVRAATADARTLCRQLLPTSEKDCSPRERCQEPLFRVAASSFCRSRPRGRRVVSRPSRRAVRSTQTSLPYGRPRLTQQRCAANCCSPRKWDLGKGLGKGVSRCPGVAERWVAERCGGKVSGTFVPGRHVFLLPWSATRTQGRLEAEPAGRALHPDLTAVRAATVHATALCRQLLLIFHPVDR